MMSTDSMTTISHSISRFCLVMMMLMLSMTACGKAIPEEQTGQYRYQDTAFCYDDVWYELTEQDQSINAIMECTPVGKYIVIKGHVNPQNGIYCIFNTETKTFEAKIAGTNLVWQGEDITSAVYSFWSDIYSYDGTLLASLELEKGQYISNIAFSQDGEALLVDIRKEEETEQREIRL